MIENKDKNNISLISKDEPLINDEEKNIIIENILREMESEKKELDNNIEENKLEEENGKEKNKKPKNYTSIEVEEDIRTNKDNKDEIEDNIILEVKNRKFDKTNKIKKIFTEDSHQNKNFPQIINYRCINYREFENKRKALFCNALVGRKEEKKIIYYTRENAF